MELSKEKLNINERTQEAKIPKLALSVTEFALAIGISKPSVYNLIASNGFPALRVGKRWIIPAKEVEKWLTDNIGKQF